MSVILAATRACCWTPNGTSVRPSPSATAGTPATTPPTPGSRRCGDAFTAARASIARAIEDEDSTGAEYALRIGDYQLIRSRIQYAQEAERLGARQEEATRELRQIRSQVLEIMGLLAAVIAFITTAANIAAGQPARPAAGLLTLAGGVTLLVFWGFHVLLIGTVSGGSAWRRVAPAVVGVILVTAGFLMTGWGPTGAGAAVHQSVGQGA